MMIKDSTTYSENTLMKFLKILTDLTDAKTAFEITNEVLNAGLLLRERSAVSDSAITPRQFPQGR